MKHSLSIVLFSFCLFCTSVFATPATLFIVDENQDPVRNERVVINISDSTSPFGQQWTKYTDSMGSILLDLYQDATGISLVIGDSVTEEIARDTFEAGTLIVSQTGEVLESSSTQYVSTTTEPNGDQCTITVYYSSGTSSPYGCDYCIYLAQLLEGLKRTHPCLKIVYGPNRGRPFRGGYPQIASSGGNIYGYNPGAITDLLNNICNCKDSPSSEPTQKPTTVPSTQPSPEPDKRYCYHVTYDVKDPNGQNPDINMEVTMCASPDDIKLAQAGRPDEQGRYYLNLKVLSGPNDECTDRGSCGTNMKKCTKTIEKMVCPDTPKIEIPFLPFLNVDQLDEGQDEDEPAVCEIVTETLNPPLCKKAKNAGEVTREDFFCNHTHVTEDTPCGPKVPETEEPDSEEEKPKNQGPIDVRTLCSAHIQNKL